MIVEGTECVRCKPAGGYSPVRRPGRWLLSSPPRHDDTVLPPQLLSVRVSPPRAEIFSAWLAHFEAEIDSHSTQSPRTQPEVEPHPSPPFGPKLAVV